MLFTVSTLPFTANAVRKWTNYKYSYYDYFTVSRIHSSMVNKLKENEQINFNQYNFV